MPYNKDRRPELATSRRDVDKTPPQAYALSLKWLAARPLSENQLRKKLTLAECPVQAQNEAVEAMIRLRYLNDTELSNAVARDAVRRGKGPLWLQQALRRRGLSKQTPRDDNQAEASDVTPSIPCFDEALDKAIAQFQRRHPTPNFDGDPKMRARALRFFASRGFSSGDTQRAFRTLKESARATENT